MLTKPTATEVGRRAKLPGGKATGSFQVRADPAWIARLKGEAGRLGLSVSAYVRSTLTREMDRSARRLPRDGQEDR